MNNELTYHQCHYVASPLMVARPLQFVGADSDELGGEAWQPPRESKFA